MTKISDIGVYSRHVWDYLMLHRTGAQFLELILEMPKDEKNCINWNGKCWPDGYPLVYVDGKGRRGNRVILKEKLGRPIQHKYQALHHCDNPKCLNPDHIWEGTDQDNKDDMVRKGRSASGVRHGYTLHPERRPFGERNGLNTHPEKRHFGEKNCNFKVTGEMVLAIKSFHSKGETLRQLMARFDLSLSTINRVLGGLYDKRCN